MYVHIGNDFVVHKGDIIGIFDFDGVMSSKITSAYLKRLESENKLIAVSQDIPKSVVIVTSSGEDIAYLSPLNSKTIKNRKILS